jgi:hypothetical protein
MLANGRDVGEAGRPATSLLRPSIRRPRPPVQHPARRRCLDGAVPRFGWGGTVDFEPVLSVGAINLPDGSPRRSGELSLAATPTRSAEAVVRGYGGGVPSMAWHVLLSDGPRDGHLLAFGA